MVDESQGPFLGPFTGLDISNASGNIEPGSSTILHNCYIDTSGSVVRRPGTFVAFQSPSNIVASKIVDTLSQREFFVYVLADGSVGIIPISVFADQFNQQAQTAIHNPLLVNGGIVKPNILVMPDLNTGSINFTVIQADVTILLIFTGVGPVVQLRFDAVKPSFTRAGAVITATDSTQFPAELYWNSTVPGYYCICTSDDTAHTVTSMSAARTWTVSPAMSSTPASIEVYHISWQWWAEAYLWNGFNFTQTRNRVNVTDADQSMAVPAELTVDLEPRYRDSQQDQIIIQNSYAQASSALATQPTNLPSGSTQWGMSQGTRYILGTTGYLTPSNDFVTFGSIETVGTISTIFFAAFRPVRFNGGTGFAVADTDVFVNNEAGSLVTGSSSLTTLFDQFRGYNLTIASGSTFWSGSPVGGKFRFMSPNLGNLSLPFESQIRIVNKVHPVAGSVTGERSVWYRKDVDTDGCYIPIPGIGESSNYLSKQFHTNGVVFGNRLVLVNPPGSVDQLSVSASGDAFGTGESFTFFQITDALKGLETDPFFINVTSNVGSGVRALQPWENNLFVFFEDEVSSIVAGETFSQNSYATSRVSNYGAWNQYSVVLTNLSILYYNRFGVFDLLSKTQTQGYASSERSIPVRPLFQSAEASSRATDHWMSYDRTLDIVYVGQGVIADSRAFLTYHTRLVLLNLSSNTWSTMSLIGANLYRAPITPGRYYSYLISDRLVLRMNCPLLMDYQQYVYNGANTLLCPPPYFNLNKHAGLNCTVPLEPLVAGLKTLVSGPDTPFVYPNAPAPSFPGVLRDDRFFTAYPLTGVIPWSTISYAPGYASVVGTPPSEYYSFCAAIYTGFVWYYPQLWFSTLADGFALRLRPNQTFTNLSTNSSGDLTIAPTGYPYPAVLGIPYNSIYRSGRFNFNSLGRLKRLKRLHLLFDPRCLENVNYYINPVDNSTGAVSVIHADYGDDNQLAQMDVFTDRSPNSSSQQTNWKSATPVYQHSQPLQGYGCDYSFSVVSIGTFPFKLTGYEWDVRASDVKRYVRGDRY